MSTKPYDLEYREYVCRLVLDDGKVVAELSRELNIAQASIFRWLKIYKEKIGWYDANGKRPKTYESPYKTESELKNENSELKKMLEQTMEENAILKKGYACLHKSTGIIFQFIKDHAQEFHVVTMCKVFNVSTSGYYAWLKSEGKAPSESELKRDELKKHIRYFFHRSHGTYGAKRIQKDLLSIGIKVSDRTVGRYLKTLGLRATPESTYIVTTDSEHSNGVFDNHLDQIFEVSEPNKVWVSDITYIWTSQGWLYLAVVLDLFARKVVGWDMMDHMRTELPLSALEQAIIERRPPPDLLHHSDRGTQYASNLYKDRLSSIQAIGSMSRTGNPYDNACAESFFATLKKEFTHRRKFKTKAEAIQAINWYIGVFYNERRRHSSNNYLSPNQAERGEFEVCPSNLESYLLAS